MLGKFTYSMHYVSCYLSKVKKKKKQLWILKQVLSQEFIYYCDTGLCFDSACWFPFLRNLPVIALPRFSSTLHRVLFNIPRCSWVSQHLGIRCHQPLAELYLELSTKPLHKVPSPWLESQGRKSHCCDSCLLWENQLSSLSLQYLSLSWRRKWQPIPVFLSGESHGQSNLVGCSLWGCKNLDMTEVT